MHKLNSHHSRRNYNIYNIRNQPDVIKAIIKNDTESVRRILSISNDWVVTDQNRRTPLHLAASLGRAEILRTLIDSECYTVNCRDNALVTPLHRACRNNHVDCVRLLVDSNADVNARTRNHLTPLHICASVGAYECAQILIEHVANIDITDSCGATAIHHAVYNSQLNILQLLLRNGAKADVQDKYGQRPIHYAAIINDPTILRTLVEEAKVDVNVRNKYLLTPLHLSVAYENLNTFTELLSFNANLEAQDIHGNNVAHWAAYISYMPIFDIVVDKMKTKLITPNLNGMTPLHFACSSSLSSSWDVILELLQHYGPQSWNVVDKQKRTPLHFAAINGIDQVALLLISRGSNCNACDCDLETPLHKAVQNVHRNVIDFLIECKANVNLPNKDGFTPLHMAAMANNAQLCKVLIDAGADPLQWDSCGRTAHYMAVFKGSLECFYEIMSSPTYLELVQQIGTDPNDSKPLILYPEIDGFKRSLLHYAAASKCTEEFLQILLQNENLKRLESLDQRVVQALKMAFARFDLNQQDIYGRTPLHYLCRRTNEIEMDITSMVRMFVECGADYSLVDNENKYPFHYAVSNGYTSALRHLINPQWFQSTNTYRKMFHSVSCPLKIAAYYGHCSVLNELLNYGFSDYEGALEIAIKRLNWTCAHRLISMVRRRDLLLKLAYFTALHGKSEGLRLFLDLPMSNLEQLLFAAALSKDGTQCVELLLVKGVNVHCKNRKGRNALFFAVLGANHSTVQLLLQSGIRFINDHQDRNVFHIVANNGDLEMFALLCNIAKSCGYYPFLCQCLLSKDKEGFCPMEIACVKKHQNILEYYVNNINRGFSQRLMLFAGLTGNFQFVDYVLKKNGFNFVHSRGRHSRTLMHYCCMSKMNQDDRTMIKALLELNFDVNQPDDRGLTPLMCAALAGNAATLKYLFKHCTVNPMMLDNDGNTLLHLACMSGSTPTAMAVIKYAKNQETNMLEQLLLTLNHSKQTCVHLAAKMSMAKVLQELLQYGPSLVTEEDVFGYTPSLYCTGDKLAAYCLVIIESYMDVPDDMNFDKTGDSDRNTDQTSVVDDTPPQINHISFEDNQTDGNDNSNCSKNNDDRNNGNNLDCENVATNKPMVNGRLSLPSALYSEENFEQRKRRMSSIVCDKISRLSFKLQNQASSYPISNNQEMNKLCNDFDSIMLDDLDADLY